VGYLERDLTSEQVSDLSLLEAASTTPPMSSTPRRPGESLTSWGKRLQAGDATLAAKQSKTKTRSGASGSFNAKHPRGRGGKWTFRSGASGAEVRGIQRRVGAKVDGAFGVKTKAAIERFQRAHGLQVDGIVGRQTVAALRGRKGNVTPGWMGPKDKAWLAGHAAHSGA
jgi:peptidoglycan hydrolase-like protein with peptidoglycan-binding domain